MRKGFFTLATAMFAFSGCASRPDTTGAADARLQLGLHYLAQQDYPAAQRNLLRAQQADSGDYRVTLALARLAQQQGDNAAAHKQYQQAARLAAGNGYVANNFGAFLCGLGHYAEAHQQFKLAETSQQRNAYADARELAGYCYLQQGELKQASALLTRALDADSSKGDRLLLMFKKYSDMGQLAAARLLLSVYHNRLPATAESLWSEIRFAAQQENAADIQRYGGQLAQSFPQSIQYQRYLANEY